MRLNDERVKCKLFHKTLNLKIINNTQDYHGTSKISIKNKLFSDFINEKDLTQKTEFHIKYKSYRNMLSTLMKKVNKTISPSFLKTT